MNWWDAIKAAIISVPKILDAFEDLGKRLDLIAAAAQDARAMELRNEQRFALIETMRLEFDKDRAEMVRRIDALERRPR